MKHPIPYGNLPGEAPTLTRMRYLLKRHTRQQTADTLNQENLRTRGGKPWTPVNIDLALNSRHTGPPAYGDTPEERQYLQRAYELRHRSGTPPAGVLYERPQKGLRPIPEVCRILTDEGIFQRNGKPWISQSLDAILRRYKK